MMFVRHFEFSKFETFHIQLSSRILRLIRTKLRENRTAWARCRLWP